MSGANALRPMPAPTDGEAAAWSARLSTRASEQLVRTLAVATFSFLVWASLFKLDQVTHAVGRVAPAGGPQVVQHLEGGILTDILAKEGDRVKRGAVLVRLSNQFSAADLTNSKTEVAAMKIQLLRLEAESAGATAFEIDPALAALAPGIASSEADLFQSRTSQLRQDLSVIDAQIQTVRAEIRSLDARLASLRSEERVTIDQLRLMERALAADAIGAQEVLERRNALQQLRTRISDVATEIPQAQARASEAEARRSSMRAKFIAEGEQKAAEIRLALSKAEQGLTAFSDRALRAEVRAPVDGVVNRIYVRTVGGVVRGGDPIMEITPIDQTVTIEARLDPKNRADVWPGQEADVKITAFAHGPHSRLPARIVDISPDAIQDDRGETYFRVRLAGDASALGAKVAVTPGMTADVDIKSRRRTILDYLMQPLDNVADKALRE
ncbi:MAG: HlyD family type I secretion periplasmic adaptor subunit [Caulobacterales bacterium]